MSEQIDCGEGWRLLREYDVVLDGDEFLNFGEWQPVFKMMIGEETRSYQVRRRIPSKPEPFGVLFYEWRVINEKAVIRIDMERAEFNATQARQLADWLNQFADWREARDL